MVTVPQANMLQRVPGTAKCQHGFQFEPLSHSLSALLQRLPWGRASSSFSSQLEFLSIRYESAILSRVTLKKINLKEIKCKSYEK